MYVLIIDRYSIPVASRQNVVNAGPHNTGYSHVSAVDAGAHSHSPESRIASAPGSVCPYQDSANCRRRLCSQILQRKCRG